MYSLEMLITTIFQEEKGMAFELFTTREVKGHQSWGQAEGLQHYPVITIEQLRENPSEPSQPTV